jgi:hypothetical protein
MAKPNRNRNVDQSATKPTEPIVTDGAGNPKPSLVVDNTTEDEGGDEGRKKITTSWEGDVITWKIPGDDGPSPTCDVSKLPEHIQEHGKKHGISAKVTDSAAKKKGATMAEKKAAIIRTIASLEKGDWNAGRSEPMGDGVLMAAMNEHSLALKKVAKFPDVIVFQKWVTEGAAGQKCTIPQFISHMEANPNLRPIVERMRLEKLASVKFDTDAFLA